MSVTRVPTQNFIFVLVDIFRLCEWLEFARVLLALNFHSEFSIKWERKESESVEKSENSFSSLAHHCLSISYVSSSKLMLFSFYTYLLCEGDEFNGKARVGKCVLNFSILENDDIVPFSFFSVEFYTFLHIMNILSLACISTFQLVKNGEMRNVTIYRQKIVDLEMIWLEIYTKMTCDWIISTFVHVFLAF